MRRLSGLALVVAASLALAACNGTSGSSSSSAPSQSGSYNSSRDSGALGPGTHEQNRD